MPQEAWIAVTRGIVRLEDPAAFRGWTYTIISRKAADWQRRRSNHRQEGPLPEEPFAVPTRSENGAAAALSRRCFSSRGSGGR